MPRQIDHVVLAARDLAAQADFYRRLGFRVGARNYHPWGTQNHIVQFDGSFLELIGAPSGFHAPVDPDPHIFSFAGFVHDYLTRREGAAMLALESSDAVEDAARFRGAGLGDFEPFHFERRGQRGDGGETHVSFTLAFARTPLAPDAGFFVCEQHRPQDFWDRGLQDHANGVTGVRGITMVAENPSDLADFLSHLTGVRDFLATSMGVEFRLGAHAGGEQVLEVLTPVAYAFRYGAAALADASGAPHIAAVSLVVSDGSALETALTGGRIPHERVHGRAVVPPTAACGVALVFAP